MEWPTNDPNRIPFHCLSSQFYPVLCCQQDFCSYFATLHCLSQLLAHTLLLGVNELLPRLNILSFRLNSFGDHQKLHDHPFSKTMLVAIECKEFFPLSLEFTIVLYNHSRHTVPVLKTFSHLCRQYVSTSTI